MGIWLKGLLKTQDWKNDLPLLKTQNIAFLDKNTP